MELKGTVYHIGAATSKQVNGKTYSERQLVIQVDEEYNGQTYSQYIPVVGKRDAIISYMNNLNVGQSITAHCNLRGVKYSKDNQEKFFLNIEVYKIDAGQQQAAPQASNAASLTTYNSDGSKTVDDLPF